MTQESMDGNLRDSLVGSIDDPPPKPQKKVTFAVKSKGKMTKK